MEISLPSKFDWVDLSNYNFRNALTHVLEDDSNLFIQAKAGCGKSLIISILADALQDQLAVVTPTGTAAVNFVKDGIPAKTIHSFFGFPSVPILTDDVINRWSGSISVMKKIDTLVIDEISMVSSHLFDSLIKRLIKVRRGNLPRLIMFGDVLQLPPVIDEKEAIVADFYKKEYGSVSKAMFFSSHAYRNLGFKMLTMDQSYRQVDEDFANNIYSIGIDSYDKEVLAYFNQRVMSLRVYEQKRGDTYIYMSPTNKQVDKVNAEYLDSINSLERYTFVARKEGEAPVGVVDDEVTIKVGAQVIMTKNSTVLTGISANRRVRFNKYYNGQIGIVTAIDKDDQTVSVRLPSGEVIVVGRSWTDNLKPEIDEHGKITYRSIGRIEQIDCKVCRAMTIHKSQGKTFDSAYLALTGWAPPGLIYVGLSRLTSLEGLGLSRPLRSTDIAISKEAIEFLTQGV